MEGRGPLYDEGHLFIAAVRVLAHRESRPPTMEEVAALIDLSSELAYHIARGLAERGIIRLMENPFETHVEIADHLAVEKLPREEKGPGIAEDLEEFHERKKRDREEMGDFFATGGLDREKKEKMSKIEEEFRRFRQGHDDEEE